MKVAGFITVMLVATASVATAQPKHEEHTGRVSYTGAAAPPVQPRPDGAWTELASATPASHGTEFIVLGKEAGDFSQLRLAAVDGKVTVQSVKVYYTDGNHEQFDMVGRLDAAHQAATTLELKHKGTIERVVITTAMSSGQYALYGSSLPEGVAGR